MRYLIVDGFAVAVHRHPRYTKDFDIWIEPTRENAQKLLNALAQFGFVSLNLQVEDFLAPDQSIQLGYPPYRMGLVSSLSGVDFSICYEARVEIEIKGVKAKFIDLENLRKKKAASGRLQDLADLEKLK